MNIDGKFLVSNDVNFYLTEGDFGHFSNKEGGECNESKP